MSASFACQPIYFGADGKELFGWLHTAAAEDVRTGAVICAPFGFEALCTHRAMRHLAGAVAAAGLPCLRFDYHGTGDSSGRGDDPQRLDAWLASVDAAIDAVKRLTGVRQVCLLGLRLGATLAALAASSRSDVIALVAIAPVVSGRGYTRELRALQLASAARSGASEPSERLEAAGFVIGEETRASIAAVDLMKLSTPPASHVLIAERDDLPSDGRWSSHLQSQGVIVEQRPATGYADMVADPHRALVPDATFARFVAWLTQRAVATAPALVVQNEPDLPPLAGPPCLIEWVDGRAVREEPVSIGQSAILSGILSLPADAGEATAAPSRGGIVLLNAGSVRRIGPSRMYVDLSRLWASRGYTVLRLDVSGIGDSPAHAGEPDNHAYSARAASDVAAAIEFLHTVAGVSDCQLVGLCSGAYHAFKAAVQGLPVESAILINPLTFFWKEGMSLDGEKAAYQTVGFGGNVSRSLRDPVRWRALVSGRFSMKKMARKSGRWLWSVMDRRMRSVARGVGFSIGDDLPTELKQAAKNKIQLHFVFSSGDLGKEVLRAEAGDTVARLRKSGALDMTIIAGADHTFTEAGTREQLFAALDRLVCPTASGTSPSAPAANSPPGAMQAWRGR